MRANLEFKTTTNLIKIGHIYLTSGQTFNTILWSFFIAPKVGSRNEWVSGWSYVKITAKNPPLAQKCKNDVAVKWLFLTLNVSNLKKVLSNLSIWEHWTGYWILRRKKPFGTQNLGTKMILTVISFRFFFDFKRENPFLTAVSTFGLFVISLKSCALKFQGNFRGRIQNSRSYELGKDDNPAYWTKMSKNGRNC